MSTYKARIEDLIGAVGDDTLITDSLTDSLNDIISMTPPAKMEFMSTVTTVGYTAVGTYTTQSPHPGVWTANQHYSNVAQTSSSASGTGAVANIITDGSGNPAIYVVDGGSGYAVSDTIIFTNPIGAQTVGIAITALARESSVDIESARILNVMRIENADSQEDVRYRNCKYASKSYMGRLKSASSDKSSMFYSSDMYPFWSYANGKIDVYPELDISDSLEVYHVAKKTVAHGDSAVDNIPDEVDAIMVIDASLRCLVRLMTDVADPMDYSAPQFIAPDYPVVATLNLETDVYGVTIATPAINGAWSATTQSFNPNTNVPEYTPPQVGGVTEELTGTMDADSAGYGTDGDFLNFSKWFSVASEFIEDEEDPELAQIQLSKIGTYVSAYGAQMQSNLNDFNKSIQRYQGDMQDAFKDGEMLGETNRQYLQIYQQDIAKYQQLVNGTIEEWMRNNMRLVEKWQVEYQSKLAEYQADIQNSQAEAQSDMAKKQAIYQWYQQQYAFLEKRAETQISVWATGGKGTEQAQQQGSRG